MKKHNSINLTIRLSACAFALMNTIALFTLAVAILPAQGQNIFVGEGNSIIEIAPGGAQTTVASGLPAITGLAIDSMGDLFTASPANDSITEITPGGAQTTFPGGYADIGALAIDSSGGLVWSSSFAGWITIEGAWRLSLWNGVPVGALTFDSMGDLLVAQNNGTITEFTPGGAQTTIATGLPFISGLAFDSTGDLFEADYYSGNIIEIAPGGAQITIATGLPDIQGLAIEPTPSPSFITNGLVAYYPFNGNANDASGNGNNGTVYGATLTTNQFGTPNSAYYFDGVSAYITTPLTNTVFAGDFTASVWYNAYDYANGWPTLLDADNGDGTFSFALTIIGQQSGASAIGSLDASSTAPGDVCYNLYTAQPISLNTWSQAVITKAGTTVTMYINSQFVTNGPVANPISTLGRFITIGGANVAAYSGAWAFHGNIDDVRIYNRALSTNEVAELYAYESSSAEQPPPLTITSQPQSKTVTANANASFSVTANATTPLNYQWTFNGTNISGANASSLTISNVTPPALGTYAVVISNPWGTITSSSAVLSMYPFLAEPFIGDIVDWGQNATLSLQAWGSGPLTYQWYDNGLAIANATNQTFSLLSIQFASAGLYSVVVSSPFGSVTNTPAQVVVNVAGVSLGFSPTLTIVGVPGLSYIIQSTTNLEDTNSWITLTNMTLTQPTQLFIDTTVDASSPFNSKHFYKVLPGQ